jgi:hypothetical protein
MSVYVCLVDTHTLRIVCVQSWHTSTRKCVHAKTFYECIQAYSNAHTRECIRRMNFGIIPTFKHLCYFLSLSLSLYHMNIHMTGYEADVWRPERCLGPSSGRLRCSCRGSRGVGDGANAGYAGGNTFKKKNLNPFIYPHVRFVVWFTYCCLTRYIHYLPGVPILENYQYINLIYIHMYQICIYALSARRTREVSKLSSGNLASSRS